MDNLEVFGEIPLARFGHTITAVSGSKVVLFGGATGDTGKYSITGDTYTLDLAQNKWAKLEVGGISPSPRAAHSSAAVDNLQMIIYGGATGGGSLASDDLYLLDLRGGDQHAQWMVVPVVGATPGRRYGHSVCFSKPHLLVFAGNTGTEAVNDVWCLNVDRTPFTWLKLDIAGPQPPVRVYNSAALCQTGTATGMMVIYGGRTLDQNALSDTWGLRKHRDGRWDWVQAPYKGLPETPIPRFQHSTLFMGPLMIVIGGRTNKVNENVPLEVYDTESSEWYKFASIKRFRHACWSVDSHIYVFGGFEQDSPSIPTDAILKFDSVTAFQSKPQITQKLENIFAASAKEAAFSPSPSGIAPVKSKSATGGKALKSASAATKMEGGVKSFKISDYVHVEGKGSGVKKMTIGELQNESLKLGGSKLGRQVKPNANDTVPNMFLNHLMRPKDWSAQIDGSGKFAFRKELIMSLAEECLCILQEQKMVLRLRVPLKVFGDIHGQYQDLMRFFDLWGCPTEQGDIECYDYLFLGDYVDRGSHSLETICLLMALKIKYPEQIHMLRGNHEDRWINNAFGFADECSSRLGEDPNEPLSVFSKVNEMFDFLPLAAVIEQKILCLHGGIGSTVHTIEQIEQIPRPLEVIHEVSSAEQQLVVDILWSDPTDNDQELGIQSNNIRDPNGTGNIVKFGPDKVAQFLKNNKLNIIFRAHECVMDGFERFAGGQLITIFSATDYCGRHKNAGAALFITRNFDIIPKLIYPLNNPEQNWITDEEPLKKRPPTPPRWCNPAARRQASFE